MGPGTMRLRQKEGLVDNQGDNEGDDVASMTPAEREIRAETVGILLRAFKRKGDFYCTKVRARDQGTMEVGGRGKVGGYVTFLKEVRDKTPREMEAMFGFAPGGLRSGAEVLLVEEELTPDRIGPRYDTSWPAGVSPRDRSNLGASYNPSYPPAANPIFQCVIYRKHPAVARLIAIVNYDQVFRWP